MSAIAWWTLPIVATVLAIVYVTWRGRPRPPEDTHEAMEARERFRRAIENVNVKKIDSPSAEGNANAADGEQPGV